MLASRRNATLYIEMTNDLGPRVCEHPVGAVTGFTRKYDVKQLVWCETRETREGDVVRERQLKKRLRVWKLESIERENPGWRDRFDKCGP